MPENSGLNYDQLNCITWSGGFCGCIAFGGFAGGLDCWSGGFGRGFGGFGGLLGAWFGWSGGLSGSWFGWFGG